MRKLLRVLVCLAISSSALSLVNAQSTYGVILGTVRDSSGASAPGAHKYGREYQPRR